MTIQDKNNARALHTTAAWNRARPQLNQSAKSDYAASPARSSATDSARLLHAQGVSGSMAQATVPDSAVLRLRRLASATPRKAAPPPAQTWLQRVTAALSTNARSPAASDLQPAAGPTRPALLPARPAGVQGLRAIPTMGPMKYDAASKQWRNLAQQNLATAQAAVPARTALRPEPTAQGVYEELCAAVESHFEGRGNRLGAQAVSGQLGAVLEAMPRREAQKIRRARASVCALGDARVATLSSGSSSGSSVAQAPSSPKSLPGPSPVRAPLPR